MRHTTLTVTSGILLTCAAMIQAQRLSLSTTTKPTAVANVEVSRLIGRYDAAAALLLKSDAESALRLVRLAPEERAQLYANLPEVDLRNVERHPVGTILFVGSLLARQAKHAAQRGAPDLAARLLDACRELGQQLEQGSPTESESVHKLRRCAAAQLERRAVRTAQELGQAS